MVHHNIRCFRTLCALCPLLFNSQNKNINLNAALGLVVSSDPSIPCLWPLGSHSDIAGSSRLYVQSLQSAGINGAIRGIRLIFSTLRLPGRICLNIYVLPPLLQTLHYTFSKYSDATLTLMSAKKKNPHHPTCSKRFPSSLQNNTLYSENIDNRSKLKLHKKDPSFLTIELVHLHDPHIESVWHHHSAKLNAVSHLTSCWNNKDIS